MAIYHAHVQVIGRSSGRSAVAAAAYRAGARLHDERIGRSHDFRAKAGVVHSEIMLPEGAPERWADRQVLWNEVEACERRKDAQLARELEVAIPRELSREEGIRLVQDFVREQFTARGMVADVNVHLDTAADGTAKPHAHVMLTMREIRSDGFGAKVREWNSAELYAGLRERWATLASARLAELGHEVRIDHRSYAQQGIGLEPQNKIGPAGARRVTRGEQAERAEEHRGIARRNGERILEDPSLVLAAVTRQHSTFTRADLARFVHRHSDGAEQLTAVMAKVEASPEIVRLGEDGRGRERLTTREMLGVERRMEAAAERLGEGRRHGVASPVRERALRAAEARGLHLGDEQRDALRHVTGERGLSLVVGYAGTGKSAMLGVARAAWEGQGRTVRGAALSGIAAEGLEAGSGIGSRTIASLEHAWGQGRDTLTSRDVLVVDEAGMVGSRQMQRVLSHAVEAGAKVVLVGDPEQLQAIEAGAAFRALSERHGTVEITDVRRQRQEWQRQATRELATGRTAEALERYRQAGMMHGHGTREEAKAALVASWDAQRRQSPNQSRIMLAATRDDVRSLNELARARLRETGELGADVAVATERGSRSFAAGDRLMFLRNERGLGVKNGTLGTVEQVSRQGLTVRLDVDGHPGGGRSVGFEIKDYAHLEHGYAATVHKAQGVTVERAHVLAGGSMDRHGAYTALTRHREGVELHWAREDFTDGRQLTARLGRERAKDTSLDYAPGFARRREIIPHSEITVQPTAERAPARAPSGLEGAAARYARLWGEEQARQLAIAGVVLDHLRPAGKQDLRTVLKAQPKLAQADGGKLAALMRAETRLRQDPTVRAQRLTAAWTRLERRHERLVRLIDRPERQAVEARLRNLVQAIHRDPAAMRVLLMRGGDLGIWSGSRLDRVLTATSEREAMQVSRDRGRGLDLGR